MKKWRYASGQLDLTLVSESFGTYLAFFYLEKLGLSAAFYALARTVYAFWDAINDPLFGHLSDRTKTRLGRRRPWLLVGVPLFLLFYLLVFWVPDWARSPQVLPYYFAVGIVLYETMATVVWTNYGALFPEMFRGLSERAGAAALKRGTELFGLILGIALTPLVYAQVGFLGMALLYGGLGGLLVLLFLKSIREDPKAQEAEPLPFIPAFRYTLGNQAFWIYSLAALFLLFAVGLFGAAMPFYAKYALGLGPEATSLLFASVLLSALPSVLLWARLAGALGPKGAWLLAIFLLALGALLLFLPRTLLEALPVGLLIGVGFGGVLVLGDVLLAEVIDRDAEVTGRRREGVYYSVYGFINRLSGPLQALSFALLTPLFGYVSGEVPGPRPEAAFRFLMAGPPFLATLLALALAFRFPYGAKGRMPGAGSS
ncbi:MFS transporter [Thermus scotoductus]|uniref:MFS transporter n=1 Tax=Thermus scotoductus TaxID=37636 RepID=A0A430R356_THESC|nr:MFS transporter [Thermus scotoductus]RTG94554.1 MFS transporter [Thermus scotoductus]RTH01777.1 MFS transporter [Thermus scotoductus]RTH99093.1 MFS transporter [Thermus scotoductus]RTI20951.1 MFS transporter [Thermus scotoductus]RTI25341.1 MFS transporter [Thermus scotoductus]